MRYALVIAGVVINVADLDPNFASSLEGFEAVVEVDPEVEVGWTYRDGALSAPESEQSSVPEPARRSKLTPAEFRNSFSAFEEVAIVDFAGGSTEGDSMQTKTIRKVVGVFFDRLKDPHLTTVDLQDPRNIDGLRMLVTIGVLTPERMVTITSGLPA